MSGMPSDRAVKRYVGSWAEWMESVGVSWDGERAYEALAEEDAFYEALQRKLDKEYNIDLEVGTIRDVVEAYLDLVYPERHRSEQTKTEVKTE